MVEPWLQSLLYVEYLRRVQLPDDPIMVIGYWRSATTYLRQLLARVQPWRQYATCLGCQLGDIAARALDRSIAEGLDERGPADRCGSLGPG